MSAPTGKGISNNSPSRPLSSHVQLQLLHSLNHQPFSHQVLFIQVDITNAGRDLR